MGNRTAARSHLALQSRIAPREVAVSNQLPRPMVAVARSNAELGSVGAGSRVRLAPGWVRSARAAEFVWRVGHAGLGSVGDVTWTFRHNDFGSVGTPRLDRCRGPS